MQNMGYEAITKPLKYIRRNDGTFTTKGDMDVELTMGIMNSLDELDRVILVSGDSDYLAPVKLIHSQNKSVVILSFQTIAVVGACAILPSKTKGVITRRWNRYATK